MYKRFLPALLLPLALLALPLALRRTEVRTPAADEADTLVVICAHTEPMKYEFEQGFRRYYRERFGRDIKLDYRSPGGTSDIVRYIGDRFEAEFRHAWESDPENGPWTRNIAANFSNPRIDSDPGADPEARRAREKFLASDVGIGIDLFAGGGTYDHARQAERGFGVDGGVRERQPGLLAPERIPEFYSGDVLYDRQGRYYGLCLASFGICYNADRLNELADPRPPRRWRDLGDPRFFNQLAVADPTKSGSANKCFEIMLQQCLAESVARRGDPEGLNAGWADGLNLIKRIVANARAITDSAGKVTRDIATGNATAGTAIDFYGLTEQEWNVTQTGSAPRIFYVAPEGGTSVSADPIQLLRGAPHPEAARAFIDYLLGPGQKLFNFKPGTPGGPERYALRRSPISRELYRPEYRQFRSDPDYDPYASGASFQYHPEWTGRYYHLLRVLIRTIALDVQPELRAAWGAIVAAGGPEAVPEAMRAFAELPFSYAEAAAAAAGLQPGRERGAVEIAALCRRWSEQARASYRRAEQLAEAGR